MRLLLDTHILVWIVLDDPRLSDAQRAALSDPDNTLLLSPLTACELTQLQQSGRILLTETVEDLQELVGFEPIDLPFGIWRELESLPDIHRDPIDRMLIAHARLAGLTLVTADAKMRSYPVACI